MWIQKCLVCWPKAKIKKDKFNCPDCTAFFPQQGVGVGVTKKTLFQDHILKPIVLLLTLARLAERMQRAQPQTSNPDRQVDKISKKRAWFIERCFPTWNHPAPHMPQFPMLPCNHCVPYFPSSSVCPPCHFSVMSCLTSRLLPSLMASHMAHSSLLRLSLFLLNPPTKGLGTGSIKKLSWQADGSAAMWIKAQLTPWKVSLKVGFRRQERRTGAGVAANIDCSQDSHAGSLGGQVACNFRTDPREESSLKGQLPKI